MTANFADRLLAAIDTKHAPVCVGIDPVYDKLPDVLKTAGDEAGQVRAVETFCMTVLERVAPHVPAVKPQSAYFEALGPAGVKLYFDVCRTARELGLLVIGDVKRNDIGSTATAYAQGHLLREDAPDCVTVNGYLGRDGLDPFIEAATATGKGLFILVRTSNPSGADLQDLEDASGVKLYETMAKYVASLDTPETLGESGFSCIGAVVGATWPTQAAELRGMMPRQLFLVPGYGAQGATARDCAASFDASGRGAIVNASRSVLYAFAKGPLAGMDWADAVEQASKDLGADIYSAVRAEKGLD
jgi:orotidine-5'-phosphate decarboxylase